jgi:KDO2-lipid IV(A) lauroyltransferase
MPQRGSKRLLDAVIGASAVGVMGAFKRMDRRRSANFVAALMRKAGPRLKEHRIGRDNLRAAYPEKSDAEIETILSGVWDNLGRVAAEFVHLDELRFGDGTAPAQVMLSPETAVRYQQVRAAGRPVIAFAAHLANWELPAVAVKSLGFPSAILFRLPNIRAIGDAIVKLRAPLMGDLIPTGLDAPVRLARLLQSGVPVGMVVDQHYSKGVEVTFFGRRCKANPLIAQLASRTGAVIHGVRVVRLPDRNSFWGEFTEEIPAPRTADGSLDIAGTMQAITAVIEGWVREHPEQWLWLHRRWR